MSLLRIPARSMGFSRTKCIRCFSSSASRHDSSSDLLNILGSSTVAQGQRSNTAPKTTSQSRTQLSPTGVAKNLGLDRISMTNEMMESERKGNYQRQIYRKWNTGDVYAPHDLSGAEQKKWKTSRKRPSSDAFDALGINPINEYKNFTMMSEFMSETGRIKHSKDTGLRPVNQRKIAKAIRRAIGLGLMPSVHRHPLVLKKASPFKFSI